MTLMNLRLSYWWLIFAYSWKNKVQLSDAYDKIKDKYRVNPPQVKVRDEGIPLIKEGRNLRGTGILDEQSDLWVNASTNDLYVNNPAFNKYKSEEKKFQLAKLKRRVEKTDVTMLPDTVQPASNGSDIEARLELARKFKHNECWEDMIQEIALVNLNLEPKIRHCGKLVLKQLAENDENINELMNFVMKNDEDVIKNGHAMLFAEYKARLLQFTEERKEFIDRMDKNFLSVESERVEKIRAIFSKYADKLFQIAYLKNPDIEKLFDAEIQVFTIEFYFKFDFSLCSIKS